MADISGLSGAFSQVGSMLLAQQREERNRELQQEQINSANNIINKAITLDKSLTNKDVTPFVRQRKVFEYIAGKERQAGLQTGTALGAYKQFFGATAVGVGTSDISKWHKKEYGDAGVMYFNPNDPKQKQFIPYDQNVAQYRDFLDESKAFSHDVVQTLKDAGVLEQVGEAKFAEFSQNPMAAFNDPVAGPILRTARNRHELSKKKTEVDNRTALGKAEMIQYFKDSKVTTSLTNYANNLVNLATTNKDLNLTAVKAKFQSEVAKWKSEDPEAFEKVSGQLVPLLDEFITNSHPSTQFKDTTGQLKDRKDYQQFNNEIMLAVAENIGYTKNPELLNVKVTADLLRDLNWNVLNNMQIGTGIRAGDMIGKATQLLFASGPESFKRKLEDAKAITAKNMAGLDPNKEDFNFEEDKSFGYILDLIMTANKPESKIESEELIKFNQAAAWIRANEGSKTKVNTSLEKYIDSLDMVNPDNAKLIRMINKFSDILNRKD